MNIRIDKTQQNMPTGNIRLGKIRRGQPHPHIPGYTNIIICSFNSKWGALSPMRLGPFYVMEETASNGYFPGNILPGFHPYGSKQRALVNILENFWQGSKIYEGEGLVGPEGLVVLPNYFVRRAQSMTEILPHRRIPGTKGKTVLGAYYDGQVYDYISSRRFYFYYYTYLIQIITSSATVLLELKEILSRGQNVLLLEYDAPVESEELTLEYIRKEYRDTSHPFGHGMVLACHLLGIRLEDLLSVY